MIYLIIEMAVLLAVALSLGLAVGWVLWRWQGRNVPAGEHQDVVAERDSLRDQLKQVEEQKVVLALDAPESKDSSERTQASSASSGFGVLASMASTQTTDGESTLTEVSKPAQDIFSKKSLKGSIDLTADDLTKIEGVTAEIEKSINKEGFFTYREIGSMNDDRVELLFEKIADLPDTLNSKDFLDQARRLYNQKSK